MKLSKLWMERGGGGSGKTPSPKLGLASLNPRMLDFFLTPLLQHRFLASSSSISLTTRNRGAELGKQCARFTVSSITMLLLRGRFVEVGRSLSSRYNGVDCTRTHSHELSRTAIYLISKNITAASKHIFEATVPVKDYSHPFSLA